MKRNGYSGSITPKSGYLIKNGKTDYVVVIPRKYTPREALAAEEFRRILALADVDIPVKTENLFQDGPAIFIGNTEAFKNTGITLDPVELKRDGFVIETVGDDFILNTVGHSGALYAVQTFLGHLADYTFYTEDEEKIAKGDVPLKEFHIREAPSFYGRNTFCFETYTNKEYALRIRSDHPDFDEMHGNTFWSSLTGHTYSSDILPADRYAAEHPDWYSFPKDRPFGKLPQICFFKGLYDDTPHGFFETFVTNLIERFIAPERNKSFFMLGIMDHNEYCCCEGCRREAERYGLSGLSMRFVNKVADAVEKWRQENAPERTIYLVSFAYLWLMDAPVVRKDGVYAPVDPSVVARDNVVVRIAPLSADYRYPITDPIHNADAAESIAAWSSVAAHLAVWDYSQDFNSVAFPYPSGNAIDETVEAYDRNGFIDVFHQKQAVSSGTQDLGLAESFAYAAKLWNVKESYCELYEEFLDAYYKDCAGIIRRYRSFLDRLASAMSERGYTGDIHAGVQLHPEYFLKSEMEEALRILQDALEQAKAVADRHLACRLYDRIYPLTFFAKWVLLCCFGSELDPARYSDLICDLRYHTQKYGVSQFRSVYPDLIRADTCEEVLDVLEQNPGNARELLIG